MSHTPTDAGKADLAREQSDAFAEKLIAIGWNPACDAQWDKLHVLIERDRAERDAELVKLREATDPFVLENLNIARDELHAMRNQLAEQSAALASALEAFGFIYNECEWEPSARNSCDGDVRIGETCERQRVAIQAIPTKIAALAGGISVTEAALATDSSDQS